MTSLIEYRSYIIAKEEGWFIAKSLDGEPIEIGSQDLLKVMRAIDTLWESIETGDSPPWFSTENTINLDHVVRRGRLKLFDKIKGIDRLKSAFCPKLYRPDSPSVIFLMIVAAIGVAMPVAILLHQLVSTSEPAIILTLAVMAIALLMAALLYNYSFIHSEQSFTWPEAQEIAYVLINIVISFVIPWLFGTRLPELASDRQIELASERIRDTD